MKQILIFNDCLNYGGTETLLVNVLNSIADKQCNVTLLLPVAHPHNILLKNIHSKVNIIYIYQKELSRVKKIIHENLMSFFPSLYIKIVKLDLKKYDTILSFKDSVYSTIFTLSKQRKILWVHNLPTEKKYGINSLKEYLPVILLKIRTKRLIKSFRRYNDVIFVSQTSKDNYIKIYNREKFINGQNLQVIYNAIDFSKIDLLSKESFEQKTEHPVFIMATRFSVEKRIDRVVWAAYKLKEEGYKFKIRILGDGPLYNDIQNLISELSLTKEISLSGYVSNPYPYMKSGDWLICSSEKESFSLVLLESIYLGTPVITTNCGGPAEISADGKYALLTENSTSGIYSGMKEVLSNPEIAEKYTTKANECLKRFDYHKWLETVSKILKVE